MTGVRNARDTLHAGFTSVRDVGNYRAFVDVALRDAIDAGWLPGPRMMVAGAFIGCRGGGGDISGLAPGRRGARAGRAAGRHRRHRRRRDQRRTPDPVRRCRPDQADRHRGGDVRQLRPRRARAERGPDPRRGRGGHPARRPRRRPRARRRGDQAGGPGRGALDRARLPDGRRGRRDDGRVAAPGWSPTSTAATTSRRTAGEHGWKADVLRKNDETTLTQRAGLREVRRGRRPDRLRHRQRHLPARPERPPVRLPRPARPDARSRRSGRPPSTPPS